MSEMMGMGDEQFIKDNDSEYRIPFNQTFRSIEIKTADGEKYIITDLVKELNIYEDMFSNTLTGEVVISDAVGASDRLKLRGNEKLKIELIKDPVQSIIEIKEFFIYSLKNKIRANLTYELYTLHFVSVEAILNEHTKVYSALNGTNSGSVKSLFEYIGSKKPIEVEDTIGSYKFVMPSYSPFECINWYCGRSISSESRGSYFLFYETLEGFKFKSVESLITKTPKMEFRYEPAGTVFVFKDVTNIREFEIVEATDSLKGVSENYSTLWTHDLVRKKLTKTRFEIEEDNKGTLNQGELLGVQTKNGFNLDLKERRDIYGSQVLFKAETQKTHTQTQSYYNPSLQTKLSAMRQFSSLKIRFLSFGTRKLQVGDVINIKFLQARLITEDTKDESADKLLSGKYLITAIRYVFKEQDFHLAIEAVKDTREV